MKNSRLLALYQKVLRWYPAEFHRAHAEQMALVAQDLLQDARSRRERTRVSMRLATDCICGLAVQHSKHWAAQFSWKPSGPALRPALRAVLLGVQIVWVFAVAYLMTEPLLNLLSVPSDQYVTGFAFAVMPAVLTVLAFRALGALRLGLWSRLVRAFVIGSVGALTSYYLYGAVMDQLEHMLWDGFNALPGWFWTGYELLMIVMCLVLFYWIVGRMARRASAKPAVTTAGR